MKKVIHVVAAVIVQYDKILCAQRGITQSLPLKWEFPGGKIEKGETPEEALRREIMEEMKCMIEVGHQIEYTIYEYDFGIIHLKSFYCTLLEGLPVMTEHASIEWVSTKELSSLDWSPADIPTVNTLINNN